MGYPKKLYKYVVPERIDILKNQLIRFTQPSALNDPFELQPMFEELLPENQLKEALNPSFEDIEAALRQDYLKLAPEQRAQISLEQFIAFVRENPHFIKKIMEDIEPSFRKAISDFAPQAKKMLADALQTKVGILSLSETIEHSLLWAHYAVSHKGFAIEFNTEHKFFNRRRFNNDELLHLRKVRYVDRSSLGRTLLDLDGDDLLVTKETSWAYEAEWRILALLESADSVLQIENDVIYLFTIPISAISGVIVGARASASFYEELKTHLQSLDNHHITLKRAVLDKTNQKIQVNEICN